MTRLDHAGGAKPAVLQVAMSEPSTADIILDQAVGWPDGAVGPFYIVIDRGLNTEEKVLCSARTGTNLAVLTRGADGTAASAHSDGGTVEHVFSAQEADDANAHVESTNGVHGLAQDATIASEAWVSAAIDTNNPTTYAEFEANAGDPTGDPSLSTPQHTLPYPDSLDPLLVRRALELLALSIDDALPVIVTGTGEPPDPTGLPDGALYLRRQ